MKTPDHTPPAEGLLPPLSGSPMDRPKTLEELIDVAAESLPDGWRIKIHVENGSGEVEVIRPDNSTAEMNDGESDIREQFRDALSLISDEIDAAAEEND